MTPDTLVVLPRGVRGLATKVVKGSLSRADLGKVKRLPRTVIERYEFLRVLAGGNPKHLTDLVKLAQHSLDRDLARKAVPN